MATKVTKAPSTIDLETLAALHVAHKLWETAKSEAQPGEYEVDSLIHLSGRITIGEPTQAKTPPAYKQVLIYVFERMLDDEQRTKLARAIRDGVPSRTKATSTALVDMLEPTRSTIERSGSVRGSITTERVG